jgi:transcriptional regulator of acetoin/glycerol metabolism
MTTLLPHDAILETLLAGIDQGVLLSTADGKILFVNPALRHLFEIPEAQPVTSFAENRTSVPMPTAAAGDNESRLRGQILFALKRTNGNKAAAAKLLGIDRTTLWRRMRRLGIE